MEPNKYAWNKKEDINETLYATTVKHNASVAIFFASTLFSVSPSISFLRIMDNSLF